MTDVEAAIARYRHNRVLDLKTDRRERLRGTLPEDSDKHGTITAYTEYSCRCDLCKQAPLKEKVEIVCIRCGTTQQKPVKYERNRLRLGSKGPYCSRKCVSLDREETRRNALLSQR